MVNIKHKSKPIDKTISLGSVLNKDVLSKRGKVIGKVSQVRIDPKKMTIEGIKVLRPLFIGNDYVGKNYIKSISEGKVILDIIPISDFPGMKVIDSNGKNIGTVKMVSRTNKTNSLRAIYVSRGLMKEDILFKKEDIEDVGKAIVLKKPFKD